MIRMPGGALLLMAVGAYIGCSSTTVPALEITATTVVPLQVVVLSTEEAALGDASATLDGAAVKVIAVDKHHVGIAIPDGLPEGDHTLKLISSAGSHTPVTLHVGAAPPPVDDVTAMLTAILDSRQVALEDQRATTTDGAVLAAIDASEQNLQRARDALASLPPEATDVLARFAAANPDVLSPPSTQSSGVTFSGFLRDVGRAAIGIVATVAVVEIAAAAAVGTAVAVGVGVAFGVAVLDKPFNDVANDLGAFATSAFDWFSSAYYGSDTGGNNTGDVSVAVDVRGNSLGFDDFPAPPTLQFSDDVPTPLAVHAAFRTFGTEDGRSPDADVRHAVTAAEDVSEQAAKFAEYFDPPPMVPSLGPSMRLDAIADPGFVSVTPPSAAGVSLTGSAQSGSDLVLAFKTSQPGCTPFSFQLTYDDGALPKRSTTVPAEVCGCTPTSGTCCSDADCPTGARCDLATHSCMAGTCDGTIGGSTCPCPAGTMRAADGTCYACDGGC